MPQFTFVLIPGAGGSAWYWHLLAPKLRECGHKAVEFQQRVARERLGISADQMPGGHLVVLSEPAELSARLIAYVATSRAS